VAKLLLVRHGVTDFNSSHKFYGHTDIDLSPEGRRQVEKLRDRLATVAIDAVCCSHLQRARTSAEMIIAGRGLEIESFPDLGELYFGDIEGLTFEEIEQRFPDLAVALLNRDNRISFPGGETMAEMEVRLRRFINGLVRYTAEQTVLVVAHRGPLMLLVCLLLEMNMDCWWRLRLDTASLSIVDTYPKGSVLRLFNSTSHLGTGI
jgi:alpha-ribazole phosphatase